jgi:DNA-binding response OmpR family regulator
LLIKTKIYRGELMQKHILIVDDDINTSTALETELLNCGYQVSVVRSGGEGMEMVQRSIGGGTRIDLAVVDIQLPGMSGTGLISRLKTEKIPIPFFALSGALDKRFLINLLKVGGAGSFERAWPGNSCNQQADVNQSGR